MKYNHYNKLIIILLTVLLVTGCLSNSGNRVATPSNDASITAVYIQSNTDSPNASSAVFTIDNVDSLIYNVDSLPYGTKVDSLYIRFNFASSLGYIMNDTVSESNLFTTAVTSKAYNFTDKVKVKNYATDEKSSKSYTIELRVHKVQTYLHVWSHLATAVTFDATENQKAVLLNNNFLYFFGNGTSNTVYTSTNAASWQKRTDLQGLPLDVNFQNLAVFGNAAYILYNGNTVYKSADGISWSAVTMAADPNYDYLTFLFSFKNKLWAVAKNKTTNAVRIANSTDGTNWIFSGKRSFGDNFPVSDFASTSFKPRVGSEKVVVIGGNSLSGKKLNSIWTAEDLVISDTLNWLMLPNSSSNLPPISNSSSAFYGSKLLLIGGNTSTLSPDTTQVRQSINEGMNWVLPDTAINKIPDEFIHRSHASLIKNTADNSLYIIGGKSASTVLSDVWKIKVNFYSFDDYKLYPNKY